ncbi:MAG TPA: hypothetical protein VGD78_21225 [Chthoniobacterales bacterium]
MRLISLQLSFLMFGVLATAGNVLGGGPDVSLLRKQLAAAKQASDKPAIIELSRRLIQAVPQDSATWQNLARTQLQIGDLDRCTVTLGTWEKAVRPVAAVIDDVRGDLAKARHDNAIAERCWRAYLAAQPNTLETTEKLAALCAEEERWRDAIEFRTRALTLKESVADRIARAQVLVCVHDWDKAYADIDRASLLQPADPAVKESLPSFELLKTFLPRIKRLDAQLAALPHTATLWLERAHLFTLANRPSLALRDCRQAIKLEPWSLRARVQAGEALLDLDRGEEAAKLNVSVDLARAENKHVSENALRALADADTQVSQRRDQAGPLVTRAKALRRLNQYLLALADAQAALDLDPNSAAAHFQAAHALDDLDRAAEARAHAARATELNSDDPTMWYYRGLLEAQRADFDRAIQSQTRSLACRESYVALQQRENLQRRLGRIREADADAARLAQLSPAKE